MPPIEDFFKRRSWSRERVDCLLQANMIRLDPRSYPPDQWAKLVERVLVQLTTNPEPSGYQGVNHARRVVAECMKALGLQVAPHRRGLQKPNRAFLDICFQVDPNLCAYEVRRREQIKLAHAIRTGRQADRQEAIEGIRKVRDWETGGT